MGKQPCTLPSERLSIAASRHQASREIRECATRAIVCHMLATTSSSLEPEGLWYMFTLEKQGAGGEREGTILGKGSKKSFLPARLPCSQLEGGCRAGRAADHSVTPSPAFPPPPWAHSRSLSAQHPFYFQAERPQLHPRYLPAKETE